MSRIDELASEPIDATDERIMHSLGEIVSASDPVPAGLTDQVKFALTVEALGAQVANLLEQEPAGVRSAYDPITTVTFSGDDITILLTLDSEHRPHRRVTGWVSAPNAAVQVHGPDGELTADIDEDGRFEVEFSRKGLVHLVIQPAGDPGARPVITPPIQI